MQSLQILEKLITDHRLQSQGKYDRVTAEWLAAKCEAMCLKVRYNLTVGSLMLCNTYNWGTCTQLIGKRVVYRCALNEEYLDLECAVVSTVLVRNVGGRIRNSVTKAIGQKF